MPTFYGLLRDRTMLLVANHEGTATVIEKLRDLTGVK